ncbi:hypothetical protein [Paenibacillus macerans]|nr:hypothetical protein [Paenibacillus macerans]MCM3699851.1 hypothetical protein [Paenibacillus macerans]
MSHISRSWVRSAPVPDMIRFFWSTAVKQRNILILSRQLAKISVAHLG